MGLNSDPKYYEFYSILVILIRLLGVWLICVPCFYAYNSDSEHLFGPLYQI